MPCSAKYCLSSSVGYGFSAFFANHVFMSATARVSSGWFRLGPSPFSFPSHFALFPFAPAPAEPSRRRLFGDAQWRGSGSAPVALEQLLDVDGADGDADASESASAPGLEMIDVASSLLSVGCSGRSNARQQLEVEDEGNAAEVD